MPDAPRDPRQLARDILSGKISIEDLAREQRRRAEARATPPAPAAMPQSNVPVRFPLPRPVHAKPLVPLQRPANRVLGAGLPRPPQRQPSVPLRKPAGPNITPGGTTPSARGPAQAKPAAPMTVPAAAALSTSAAKQSSVYQGIKLGAEGKSRGVLGQPTALGMVRDRAALRRAVIMAEILGKPLSLRDDAF